VPDTRTEYTHLLPRQQAQQLIGCYVNERARIQDEQKDAETFHVNLFSVIQHETTTATTTATVLGSGTGPILLLMLLLLFFCLG